MGEGRSEEGPAGGVRAHRLAGSSSAYLRGAAEQPIAWFPWGAEAFAEAKRSRRPILLDIGAVWCHWCHVMDEGTYADEEVARLIGQHFVAVKVDRDENPEVDRRYQREVSSLSGEGGWPLTAFLTPDGEVFLGGTYFPPQDGHGRPGFRRVLREVARLYREEPEQVRSNAEAVRSALVRGAPGPAPPGDGAAMRRAVSLETATMFDPVNGGFGQAPKFPHPTALSFLLLEGWRSGDASGSEHVRLTLERMADGGMYDQLGGGFHRYSVDEAWHIPHFEKMGVDNAALLDAYVEGFRRFRLPRFREVVAGTIAWTREVLADPAGGFGSSQDADNAPGDDGSYFTWSRPELKAALAPEELRLVSRYYGVGTDGRMPHDPERNVLFRLLPMSEAIEGTGLAAADGERRLAEARAKLLEVRRRRPTPVVDRATYASINGAFVRAFAHAGRLLGDRGVIEEARRAADRFLAQGYAPDRGVAHRLDGTRGAGWGLLDDQAEFALGLVELGAATREPQYLARAGEILETTLREYAGEAGLLRDIAPKIYDGPNVGSVGRPSYPLEDTPHLAANAAAALAFVRLAAITGEERWERAGRTLVGALAGRLMHAGLFGAGSALAAGLLDTPAARVVIVGPDGPATTELARAAAESWHPLAYVYDRPPPPPFALPEEFSSPQAGDRSRALVCFGSHCLAPIEEPAGLAAALSARPTS